MDRIADIEDDDMYRRARGALRFLRVSPVNAYSEFYDEHVKFLKKNPDADERKRKRWLHFLERPGVECCLWPQLFWDREMCISFVRFTTRGSSEIRGPTPIREGGVIQHSGRSGRSGDRPTYVDLPQYGRGLNSSGGRGGAWRFAF